MNMIDNTVMHYTDIVAIEVQSQFKPLIYLFHTLYGVSSSLVDY